MTPHPDHLGLEFDLGGNSTDAPRIPASWVRWFELYGLAPDLQKLHRPPAGQARPPRTLSDFMFCALCACFADPSKREILRALILDLLAEDILEMLVYPDTEDRK